MDMVVGKAVARNGVALRWDPRWELGRHISNLYNIVLMCGAHSSLGEKSGIFGVSGRSSSVVALWFPLR